MNTTNFGLGCGSFSTANKNLLTESTAIIRSAMEHNVTFLNTADFYGAGESEMAISHALYHEQRDATYLSLKFGALMAPNGMMYGLDVHPDRIKNYLTHSLKRLKLDYIDLYQPARIDLAIPVEETIGAISDLVKEGYVKEIGITQVDAQTLRKAHATHPISYVEMEYSLFNRSMEKEIVPVARELGINMVAFGILAHGLLSGAWTKEKVAQGKRAQNKTTSLLDKDNIEENILRVEALRKIAEEKQLTLSQLIHAWALSKGEDILPLIGVSKLSQFEDSIQARQVKLSNEEISRIEKAVPEDKIKGKSFRQLTFRNGVIV
ncbi:aldo/keto reductase [Listeria sp. PSOL-1]|uniref:aldo/keto reductase n=1 Tax=Listeria sp. PSOL-1 TaxID=1844999 RepID=UPI0013CFE239|nr:aldo/keto reductase [Listeria sp. PSOL-1]